LDGSGRCIGIIELGGGCRAADIGNLRFKELGLKAPNVKTVQVDGGKVNQARMNCGWRGDAEHRSYRRDYA